MWQMDLDFTQPYPTTTSTTATSTSKDVQEPSLSTSVDPSTMKFNRDGSRHLEDFGEDLNNTRKARKAKPTDDQDIETQLMTKPLEKVWSKKSILQLENRALGAFLYLQRQSMPTRRPTKSWELARYVRKAKACIELQQRADDDTLTGYDIIDASPKLSNSPRLQNTIAILENVDPKYWEDLTKDHPSIHMVDVSYSDPSFIEKTFGDIPLADGKERIYLWGSALPKEGLVKEKFKLIEGSDYGDVGRQLSSYLDTVMDRVHTQEKSAVKQKKVDFYYQFSKEDQIYTILGKRSNVYLPLAVLAKDDLEKGEVRKTISNYINENREELTSKYNAVRDAIGRDVLEFKEQLIRDRVGTDWRHGKDVSPEQFMEVFGFRGVEFGNWVQQGKDNRERQWMLNNAFDAFNDLAELLDVPPKAMALDGTLGLAFGSRGKGKANAHYEPASQVINLTKTRGYSSLAHEWFHALDHYIARSNSEDMHKFQSEYAEKKWQLTPEGKERLTATIKNYTHCADFYIHDFFLNLPSTLNQPRAQQAFNDGKDISVYFPSTPNNQHFTLTVKKDDVKGVYPDILKTSVRPELFHAWRETVEAIRSTRMSERTKARAKLVSKNNIEQDYWFKKVEQGARSFEAFVETKLKEQGKISDFLTVDAYSENEIAFDPKKKTASIRDYYPYLDGDDVQRVSQQFQKLFDTIKTRETEKGVMLFSMTVDKPQKGMDVWDAREELIDKFGEKTIKGLEKNGFLTLAQDENEAEVLNMVHRAQMEGKLRLMVRNKDGQMIALSMRNRKTGFIVDDASATLENTEGYLATFDCGGKRGFPRGHIVLKEGDHIRTGRGSGALHSTVNVIQDSVRNFHPELENKTEASIVSILDVLQSTSQIHRYNSGYKIDDQYIFYSNKYKSGVVTVYKKDANHQEIEGGIFNIITQTPMPLGMSPEKRWGNEVVINKGFLSFYDHKRNSPKSKSGAIKVASDVLEISEIGASTALPTSRTKEANLTVETSLPTDMVATLGEHNTTNENQKNENLYKSVDYTERAEKRIKKIAEIENNSTRHSLITEYSPQGFYDRLSKRSYLITNNLSKETAYPVLLHEVGVHMACDSILKTKFEPVMDQAVKLVHEGEAKGDPVAQQVINRLNMMNLTPDQPEYKEELTAYLVEETAKRELKESRVIRKVKQATSLLKAVLVDQGVLQPHTLTATDIVQFAHQNVEALSKLEQLQAFKLTPEMDDKQLFSRDEVLPQTYQEQKAMLDKPLSGKFVLPAYDDFVINQLKNMLSEDDALALAGKQPSKTDVVEKDLIPIEVDETQASQLEKIHFDEVTLGENLSIEEAIIKAESLYGKQELDNIRFNSADGEQTLFVDPELAQQVASDIEVERKFAEFKELEAQQQKHYQAVHKVEETFIQVKDDTEELSQEDTLSLEDLLEKRCGQKVAKDIQSESLARQAVHAEETQRARPLGRSR